MERNEGYIAGLLRERQGYVAVGNPDGVRAVDEQLAEAGHVPEAAVPDDPAIETAVARKPRKRTTRN